MARRRPSTVSYLRIAGYVGAALALAFLWWRVSLSFSQGDVIDAQQDHISGLEMAAARDQRIATEIAVFRGQQSDVAKQFREDLAKHPLTREVQPHVDPKTGIAEPCHERIPARYRELFNRAVTGAPGVP